MAQVSNIQGLTLKNAVASHCAKSSSGNSDFSQIMSFSSGQANKYNENSYKASSVKNVKEKLENSASSVNLHQSETVNAKDIAQTAAKGDTDTEYAALEQANECVSQLKEDIAKVLGISLDELEKIMEESGISAIDLLNADVLQNLLLQVNDVVEPTELLTNETLCNQMKELLQVVDTFEQSVDLEKLSKQIEALSQESFTEVMAEEIKPVQEKEEQVSPEMNKGEETVESKEPVITVQKEEDTGRKGNAEREENMFGRNKSNSDSEFQKTQLNQFVQNLSDSIQQSSDVDLESAERLQQMQNIVNQVVEKIKVTLSADTTSMEMQLNPENLGKVTVSVVSKNGEMTAAFTVESQLAKEALESQLVTLKDSLNEQGVKVEAIEVMVAEQGLSQDQFSNQTGQSFQQQSKRKGNANRMLNHEEKVEENLEEESIQTISENGTVDFSA